MSEHGLLVIQNESFDTYV